MRCDEYGQRRPAWHLNINITKCRELWHKLRNPRKSKIDNQLLKARQQDREFEHLINGKERERLSKEQLIERLSHELRTRSVDKANI